MRFVASFWPISSRARQRRTVRGGLIEPYRCNNYSPNSSLVLSTSRDYRCSIPILRSGPLCRPAVPARSAGPQRRPAAPARSLPSGLPAAPKHHHATRLQRARFNHRRAVAGVAACAAGSQPLGAQRRSEGGRPRFQSASRSETRQVAEVRARIVERNVSSRRDGRCGQIRIDTANRIAPRRDV